MPLLKPHITVEDLRIAWGAQVLMEHVNFQVERGTVFAILGGFGCGKSSLLRYLIGLEQPQAGRIEIDGVGEPHRYEGIPPFGVLFQSGALFSSMTLAENLALPLTAWTPIRGPCGQGKREVLRQGHGTEECARLKQHAERRYPLITMRLSTPSISIRPAWGCSSPIGYRGGELLPHPRRPFRARLEVDVLHQDLCAQVIRKSSTVICGFNSGMSAYQHQKR